MCNSNQANMQNRISHHCILKDKSILVQGDTDTSKKLKN